MLKNGRYRFEDLPSWDFDLCAAQLHTPTFLPSSLLPPVAPTNIIVAMSSTAWNLRNKKYQDRCIVESLSLAFCKRLKHSKASTCFRICSERKACGSAWLLMNDLAQTSRLLSLPLDFSCVYVYIFFAKKWDVINKENIYLWYMYLHLVDFYGKCR